MADHLPPAVPVVVMELRAGALAIAQKMSPAGRTVAARGGFITGMHWAVLVGGVLLIVCAGYVWLCAPGLTADEQDDPDEFVPQTLREAQ